MKDSIKINSDFNDYVNVFLEENAKHNLISKNDERYLYEKHIYDSLGIKLFIDKYGMNCSSILDIGCGGGFPCVPIAIEYPNLKVTGIDSIGKKIASIEVIKQKLGLNNLDLICSRVENLRGKKYDLIVSRAVADLSKIATYAAPLLNKDGYFVAYKSRKAEDEINAANKMLKDLSLEFVETIEYALPMQEIYERKLICLKKL